MNVQKKDKGFTIIEVVLVLAIAGLIFMMVFVALPALQRGQRDAQRKNDLSRMMTQLTSYSSNNRGGVPTTAGFYATGTGFITKYLGGASKVTGSEYIDPTTGLGYTAVTTDLTTNTGAKGDFYYQAGMVCDTDGAIKAGTARNFAIQMVLEGQTAPYCTDNH